MKQSMKSRVTQPYIVVIEDEVDFLESLQRSFRVAGFDHFTLQQDPQCALAFLEKGGKADVVLMNGLMAGMPGTEMLERITASRPDTPCIVMTGSTDHNDIAAHFKKGAAEVLVKPFSHARLVDAIVHNTQQTTIQNGSRYMKQNPQFTNARLLKQTVLKKVLQETGSFLQQGNPALMTVRHHWKACTGAVKADPDEMRQLFGYFYTFALHSLYDCGGELDVSLQECSVQEESGKTFSVLPGGEYVKVAFSIKPGDPDRRTAAAMPPDNARMRNNIAFAADIIQRHGGTMWCDISLAETVFTVILPRDEESCAAQPQRPTILIVDDEETIRTVYRMKLKRDGYSIVIAENGRAALDLFRADPNGFDLIITDMIMPEMNGDEFLLEVLTIRPDMPFIITSGSYGGTSSNVLTAAVDRNAFLQKPCSLDLLAETVKSKLADIGSQRDVTVATQHV